MATKPPSSLTAEQLYRLHAGLTCLRWTFVIMLIVTLLSFLLEPSGYAFFSLFPWILGIVGVSKINGVVLDMLPERPQSSVAPEPEDPSVQDTDTAVSKRPTVPRGGFGSLAMKAQHDNAEEPVRSEARKPAAGIIVPEGRDVPLFGNVDWEQWIGQKLLQKVGILIVLIGMIVFLKYSFDNRLIGELGRIALSTFAALLLLGCGEWFHRKYTLWSQAFTGAGLALLYFTVWAAHVFYRQELNDLHGIVVSPAMAMGLYSLITLIGAVASIRYRAQTIAWFTVLGGYLTPLLISTAQPDAVSLVTYLAILSGGILTLSWYRKWPYLSFAAFGFTQLYLSSLVYSSAAISDVQQALIAIGFFILFALPPLLYQFRLQRRSEADDLLLILFDGLAVFLPVVDALGGFGGDYVGVVCLGLAAVYVAFAALALRRRSEDAVLVNTYLLVGIGLIALAMFAQMEWEWVAAGWAPFSVLLLLMAKRLKRPSVFACAGALFAGALLFLLANLPFDLQQEALWHPFTSHWALLSYVVFASLLGWIFVSRSLPEELVPSAEFEMQLIHSLHAIIALIVFAAVTFEATGLRWVVSLPLAYSYLGFTAVATLVFALTGITIWFIAAFLVQILVLLFTFVTSPSSGMVLFGSSEVAPFFHPWAAVSVLSLVAMMALLAVVVIRQKNAWINHVQTRGLLIGVACAQVWIHLTVEIDHLRSALSWSPELYNRVLSGWWILFTVPFFVLGIRRSKPLLLRIALLLLYVPLLKDVYLIDVGAASLFELALWTILPIILLLLGTSTKQKELLHSGVIMLLVTMAADFLQRIDAPMGLWPTAWWTVCAFIVVAIALRENHRLILGVSVAMLFATMAADFFHHVGSPVGLVPTAWWTLSAFIVIAIALYTRQRVFLGVGIAMIVSTIFFDQVRVVEGGSGLIKTIWWTIVGLVIMSAGFVRREKILRQFAICIFGAATVKLLLLDFSILTTGVRIGASVLTGLLLIGASYLYQRFDSMLTPKR